MDHTYSNIISRDYYVRQKDTFLAFSAHRTHLYTHLYSEKRARKKSPLSFLPVNQVYSKSINLPVNLQCLPGHSSLKRSSKGPLAVIDLEIFSAVAGDVIADCSHALVDPGGAGQLEAVDNDKGDSSAPMRSLPTPLYFLLQDQLARRCRSSCARGPPQHGLSGGTSRRIARLLPRRKDELMLLILHLVEALAVA
jgi:hypothetical protein